MSKTFIFVKNTCGAHCLQHELVLHLRSVVGLESVRENLDFSFNDVESLSPTFANEFFMFVQELKDSNPNLKITLTNFSQRLGETLQKSKDAVMGAKE